MSFVYKGFDVDTRLGAVPVIIVRTEVEKDVVRTIFGQDYPALFVVNKYDVYLYSCEDMEGTVPPTLVSSMKGLKGFSKLYQPSKSLELEFEIPVSSKLIDHINEIRRRNKIVALSIHFWFDAASLSPSFILKPSLEDSVYKISPSGVKRHLMTFSTEEINLLMKKLGYAEFIKFDIPVPLVPEVPIEILKKSAVELKNVEDEIVRGIYSEALRISRNIIMNYLTEPVKEGGNKKRVLKEEISNYVLNTIPSSYKSIYEGVFKGIEDTLLSNLDHIHKFVKEDTGKLIAMPSREEAEYVYLMLVSILRYISQLILTWSQTK
jgi:hypothetical protein